MHSFFQAKSIPLQLPMSDKILRSFFGEICCNDNPIRNHIVLPRAVLRNKNMQ